MNPVTTNEGVYTVELNEDLLKEAKRLVDAGATLPAKIAGFKGFFVASADEETVQALSGFVKGGVSYKIGTKFGR